MFKIVDWNGNSKFFGQMFKTEEEAFAFLQERFPEDEDLQEFYVEETATDNQEAI